MAAHGGSNDRRPVQLQLLGHRVDALTGAETEAWLASEVEQQRRRALERARALRAAYETRGHELRPVDGRE